EERDALGKSGSLAHFVGREILVARHGDARAPQLERREPVRDGAAAEPRAAREEHHGESEDHRHERLAALAPGWFGLGALQGLGQGVERRRAAVHLARRRARLHERSPVFARSATKCSPTFHTSPAPSVSRTSPGRTTPASWDSAAW